MNYKHNQSGEEGTEVALIETPRKANLSKQLLASAQQAYQQKGF